MKTLSFYDYLSFSDTARNIKKYTRSDSTDVLIVWPFFDSPFDFPIIGDPETMADTIIDKIAYKRLKFIYSIPAQGNIKQPAIAYFRCDKKNTMFKFDNRLSNKIGCPRVRTDNLPLPQYSSAVSQQIEFVADKLTKEELKVFQAWEKNAKNDPVKK